MFLQQDPKKQILTLRQRIILSHVWSLAPEEVMCLDWYSKQYATGNLLSCSISTDHDYKDRLFRKGQQYNVFYVNTCFSDLETMEIGKNVLLSFRENVASSFRAVLILKNPKPNQLTDDTPQYLIGEGVQ